MPRRKIFNVDMTEANYLAGFLHFCAAMLAMISMVSNDWVIVSPNENNSTSTIDEFDTSDIVMDMARSAEKCTALSCVDFWRPVQFGGFLDRQGNTHITFNSPNKVLVDCANPVIANVFYVIIALCFVVAITSIISCIMAILPPPHPFLHWIKRNTLLEMFNMIITLVCCVLAIVVQSQLSGLRPDDDVSLGCGVFVVCFAGLFSFAAATVTIRHATRLNRMRRMDNQRIICARSLRSWRDAARRADDTLPIVDFERYLDSATAMNDMSSPHDQTKIDA